MDDYISTSMRFLGTPFRGMTMVSEVVLGYNLFLYSEARLPYF
jgi:hypothetical protein